MHMCVCVCVYIYVHIYIYTHAYLYMCVCVYIYIYIWVSQVVLKVKNLPANAGDIRDVGLIPGLERSPGGGHIF